MRPTPAHAVVESPAARERAHGVPPVGLSPVPIQKKSLP